MLKHRFSFPPTQLVINLETLGRSDVTMPGDDVDTEMTDTATSVDVHTGTEPPARTRNVRRIRRPGNLKKWASHKPIDQSHLNEDPDPGGPSV